MPVFQPTLGSMMRVCEVPGCRAAAHAPRGLVVLAARQADRGRPGGGSGSGGGGTTQRFTPPERLLSSGASQVRGSNRGGVDRHHYTRLFISHPAAKRGNRPRLSTG